MNHRLKKAEDGWAIALADAQVSYIHVDFRLGLDIGDATGIVRVTIGQICRLKKLGSDVVLNPDDAPSVAPILALFNANVDAIAIRRTGELTVQFADGERLDVCPSDRYEAWEIACEDDEFLIVCQPGGEVSIFQESAPES